MSTWGVCPYDINWICQRLRRPCEPGAPGCILFGRVEFTDLSDAPPSGGAPRIVATLDLREVAPQTWYTSLLDAYEQLQSGEALQLLSDRDAAPLYHRLCLKHKGQFEWRRVQEGPATWEVLLIRR